MQVASKVQGLGFQGLGLGQRERQQCRSLRKAAMRLRVGTPEASPRARAVCESDLLGPAFWENKLGSVELGRGGESARRGCATMQSPTGGT